MFRTISWVSCSICGLFESILIIIIWKALPVFDASQLTGTPFSIRIMCGRSIEHFNISPFVCNEYV